MRSVHWTDQYRRNLNLKRCHCFVQPCRSPCLIDLMRKLMGMYLLGLEKLALPKAAVGVPKLDVKALLVLLANTPLLLTDAPLLADALLLADCYWRMHYCWLMHCCW